MIQVQINSNCKYDLNSSNSLKLGMIGYIDKEDSWNNGTNRIAVIFPEVSETFVWAFYTDEVDFI